MVDKTDAGGLILSSVILRLRGQLAEAGLDWRAIERAFKLDPDQAHQGEQFVPLANFAGYLYETANVLNDEAYGLKLGHGAPIGIASVYDYVSLAAPSFNEAFDNWLRYQSIISSSIIVTRSQENGRAYLNWEFPETVGPQAQICGMTLGFASSRIRRMAGDRKVELFVDMPCKQPDDMTDHTSILGPNVRFSRPHLRLGVPVECLEWKPVDSESNLLTIIEKSALHILQAQHSRGDVIFRISSEISECLKQGEASLMTVAGRLGMSRRGLQRQLEHSNTTFRALLDDVRHSLALRYLKESDLSLSEIAYRLGYSELSAFSRAAKGWFGVPPLQMRHRAFKGKKRKSAVSPPPEDLAVGAVVVDPAPEKGPDVSGPLGKVH
ncbi:AraC family transcriptional regulator ligand-binding domain-containing protein [Roseibium sp.]|uniref:AraC family transcriptional regulator n=1 Tax=Roseibium sp. TaxID=1936156 RepID=UPI003A970760